MRSFVDLVNLVKNNLDIERYELVLIDEEYLFLENNWDDFLDQFPAEEQGNISLIDGDVIDESRKYILVSENLECQHYM